MLACNYLQYAHKKLDTLHIEMNMLAVVMDHVMSCAWVYICRCTVSTMNLVLHLSVILRVCQIFSLILIISNRSEYITVLLTPNKNAFCHSTYSGCGIHVVGRLCSCGEERNPLSLVLPNLNTVCLTSGMCQSSHYNKLVFKKSDCQAL